ncbi:MAG: hypothetical protein HY287_13645 [Planctomycetes bacterium]|nr:hypothetical protein [Planctomycetota bacterium]MBI3835366.1 hypothetical protein [Planctomycetota bacterium]
MRCTQFAALSAVLTAISGCTSSVFAPLGGDTAGGRGKVGVLFLNNTPNSAVFTVGTYDTLDPASIPNVKQFGLNTGDTQLAGNSSSKAFQLDCGRVFSIGGQRMLDLIGLNITGSSLDSDALVQGAEFFTTDVNSTSSSVGSSEPFEAILGEDFSCGSLLVVYFEVNDAGGSPFRIDFQVIPARSNR